MTYLGIVDLIHDILANSVSIQDCLDYFVKFTAKNQFNAFLAVLIIIPMLAVLLYAFIERALDFIKQFKSEDNRKKNKTILIVILSISTFFSILFVDNIVRGELPRPKFLDRDSQPIIKDESQPNQDNPIIIVKDVMTLRWDYDLEKVRKNAENNDKKFAYLIQSSLDKRFTKTKEYFTRKNFKVIESKEPPSKLYWKITPGYLSRTNPPKFEKIDQSSYPLQIFHYGSILSKIKGNKQIKVCTSRNNDRSFLAYESRQNLGSDPKGLEIDLIKKIADNIIVDGAPEKKYRLAEDEPSLAKVFDQVGRGECDLAISSLSITREREAEYDLAFSLPYYQTNLALIINTRKYQESTDDISRINLLQLLSGKTVGVLKDSTAEKTIERFNELLQTKSAPLIEPKIFDRVSDALIDDLDHSKPTVDFVLADKIYTESYIAKSMNNLAMLYELTPDLYPPEFPQQLIGENYGIAVNYKASDLLEKINQTIEQLNKNNQLDKMIKNHQSYYNETIKI